MVSPGAKAGWSVRSSLAASFCMMGWIDIGAFLLRIRIFSIPQKLGQFVIQVLPRCENRNAFKRSEREEILVAGDDQVCVTFDRAFEDEVVLWVAADACEVSSDDYPRAALKKI